MNELNYRGYLIAVRSVSDVLVGCEHIMGDEGRVQLFTVRKKKNPNRHPRHVALTLSAAEKIVDGLIRAERAEFREWDAELIDIIIEDEFENSTTEKKKKPKSKGFTVTRMVEEYVNTHSDKIFDAANIANFIWKEKKMKVKMTTIYAAFQICVKKGIIRRVGRGTYIKENRS